MLLGLRSLFEASGGASVATNEPFTPTGTSGQLTIGGQNVTSGAVVTNITQTYMGYASTLKTSSRTNLLIDSTLTGTGTTPTGWTYYTDTGTSVLTTSAYGSADGAQALAITSTVGQNFIYRAFTVAASTTYCISMLVETISGTISAQNVIFPDAFPAGAVVAYPVCSANPSGGATSTVTTGVLVVTVTTSTTAGTVDIQVGVGADYSNVGSIKFSRPQVEVGTSRGAYIPTVASTVSVTDYSYTNPGVVTLGQTAAGTYVWSGSGSVTSGVALPALRQKYEYADVSATGTNYVAASVAVTVGDLIVFEAIGQGATTAPTAITDNASSGGNSYAAVAGITDTTNLHTYIYTAVAKATQTLTISSTTFASTYPSFNVYVIKNCLANNATVLYTSATKVESTAATGSRSGASVTVSVAGNYYLLSLWRTYYSGGLLAENGGGFALQSSINEWGSYVSGFDRIARTRGQEAFRVKADRNRSALEIGTR